MLRSTSFVPFVLFLLPLAAQEKHTLRYAYQPGSVVWALQVQQMKQDMQMGGRSMQMSTDNSTWLETKVESVKDGVATLAQRYARITIQGGGMGQKFDYDSDVPGSKAGPMSDAAKLVGKTAKIVVDARGTVSEATLPEDTGKALEKMGSSLKEGFEQSIAAWPEQPVAIGETWQAPLAFPMGQMGTMKATVTNKLVSVQDGVVTLDVQMAVDASGIKLPGGLSLQVGKATGTMKASLTSCMPIESSLAIELKTAGDEKAPMQMTLGITQSCKQVPAPAPKAAPAGQDKGAAAPKTGGK